jgi:hypothetical protein
MFKHIARNLTLALTLTALVAPAIHAQTVTATAMADDPGVTGGDPEPTSPNVVQMILLLLQLA